MKSKEKIIETFDQVALGFNNSATNAIIKQFVTVYKCSHIHGKGFEIIEMKTAENAEMFNSALVSTSDDAGRLHNNNFTETEWNFKAIGEGMFSVQTLNGVKVFDEYVDIPIGIFDKISSFINGLAVVEKDGKLGIIGKTGQEIVPITYENNSYQPTKGEKVEQFEVLNGVIVAVGESTIDVYSKHGEKLYVADKNNYDATSFSDSFSRRFITYLSRIEKLRDIHENLNKKQNKHNEYTINRMNVRIDTSISDLIRSLGSVNKYNQFINELGKVNGRQNDPMYKKVKDKKYKKSLLEEIEFLKDYDPC